MLRSGLVTGLTKMAVNKKQDYLTRYTYFRTRQDEAQDEAANLNGALWGMDGVRMGHR